MALLRYLKPRDGLPNPKGSLSLSVTSPVIARANREVQEAITSKEGKKRGLYERYSPEEHAEIGQYTCHHGIAVVERYISQHAHLQVSIFYYVNL